MTRLLLLSSVAALTLFAGCNGDESRRENATRTLLVGTWLRETDDGTVKSRRVLALAADSKFTERVVVSMPGNPPERRELAGEWSYDGQHLKRRYLQENGRQFAGGVLKVATFPLVEVAESELRLQDTVEGREVTFRRVAADTQP